MKSKIYGYLLLFGLYAIIVFHLKTFFAQFAWLMIYWFLIHVVESYKKKIITRDSNEPYLIRYTIFTCKWFSVKIHNILLSDDNCLHDHPWAFMTLIIKSGYTEHSLHGEIVKSKFYGPGKLLYRHLHWIHRLEVSKPAWTLVVTFRKKKDMWGFFTPDGWLPWRQYKATGGCE